MISEQPANPAHLTTLTWADRRALEDRLLAFDQGWHEARLAEAAAQLPADPALRRAALLEMIKIDLERQWQQGRRPTLHDYLTLYPELGTASALPIDLVRAELEVRRQFDTQAEAPSPRLFTTFPSSFGRYRVLKLLGKGNMGSVYLADDPVLDRQVALKVPHFGPEGRPEVLQRFTYEAQAVSRLHHPNLCPVYDAGVCEQVPFMTMAYLDGKTLLQAMTNGAWPPAKALRLVQKLASAMAAAHAQGVLHRDLKPANIMFSAGGEPVLADFGLARRWQGDIRVTNPGSLVGTPAYMAPEQIAGHTEALGPACDIYGLGVILFELLTGRLPFNGTLADVLVRIANQPPPAPSSLRAELGGALDELCLRALAKEPAARYRNMNEFAAAMDDALARLEKPQASSAASAPRKTHTPWRIVALFGGLLALLAGGWWLWHLNDKDKPPPTSPIQPSPHTTSAEQKAESFVELLTFPGHQGEVTDIADVDQGKRAVSIGIDDTVRWWDLTKGVELPELRLVLPGSAGSAAQRVLSRDGRYLLSGRLQSFSMWDLRARKSLRSFILAGPHLGGLALSADGRRILAGGNKVLGQPFLQVWDAESGERIALWEEQHNEWVKRVAISADGSLALAADKVGARLWQVEPEKLLRPLPRDLVSALAFGPDGRQFVLGEATGAILLYDVRDGGQPRRFTGHTAAVRCLLLPPDGQSLFSGSDDGTLRIWDIATARPLQIVPFGPADTLSPTPITCLALDAEQRHLLAGTRSGSIRLWEKR